MTIALLVLPFFYSVTIDVLNVFWLQHVDRGRAGAAAHLGVMIGGLRLLGILQAVNDPRAIFFLLLGQWTGVFLGVQLRRRFTGK